MDGRHEARMLCIALIVLQQQLACLLIQGRLGEGLNQQAPVGEASNAIQRVLAQVRS